MITKNMMLGVLLAAIVSALGIWTGNLQAVKNIGFSAVTMAIIIGIIVGNTIYPKIAEHTHEGVNFSKAKLLRLGIILYGFHLTFQQIESVGANAIIADAIIVASTFMVTWVLARRLFKLDEQTAILIGAGSSICGAAAVMATEPVIKAHADKVTIAVATVVIFGTIGIFLYPEMYYLNVWPFDDQAYGIYIGSTVHEVAQVYAAGGAISQNIADVAVTTKMIRVIMLAPFLLILSWWLSRRQAANGEEEQGTTMTIPWFAVLFIVVSGFNSLHLLPDSIVKNIQLVDTILLTMAMASLGLTTHLGAVKQAGIKPMLLGALVMVWLVVIGGVLQLILN